MVAPMTIREHKEVLGSDGVHVGTVDGLEGRDQVKLTKDEPTPEVSITSFRWRGSTMWMRASISNSPAPRPRRAGKATRFDP